MVMLYAAHCIIPLALLWLFKPQEGTLTPWRVSVSVPAGSTRVIRSMTTVK